MRALPILGEGPRRRWLGPASVGLGLVLFGSWVLAVVGGAPTARLAGWVLPLALGVAGWWLVVRLVRELRHQQASRRLRAALVLLALAARLIGIDFEVFERGYADEGIYRNAAIHINDGNWVRPSFIYGHLTYNAYAFALWLAHLWPGAWPSVAARVFGETEPAAQDWVVLRALVAILSAAAVLPVWGIAVRIGGVLAGLVGALLYVFSPLLIDGAHLIISDTPSACLATFSLFFAARLQEHDHRRDWLLGGLFAGLAAATKYPAGVVALALIAVAVRAAITNRRVPYGLLLAGTTALGVFVLVQPSLLELPLRHSMFAKEGMLFGFRQYSDEGWTGVVQPSNLAWYGGRLAASFGWAALAIGTCGWLFVGRPGRARLLWLLPFPVLFSALLLRLNVSVERNLLPIVPALCALLGAGIIAAAARLARHGTIWRRRWAAALVAAILAQPVTLAVAKTASLARLSTRDIARRHVFESMPPGTRFLAERQAPRLDGPTGGAPFTVRRVRFVGRVPWPDVVGGDYDVLILSANAYRRFTDRALAPKEHHREMEQRYLTMLGWKRLWEITPGPLRGGPHLVLLEIPRAVESAGSAGGR